MFELAVAEMMESRGRSHVGVTAMVVGLLVMVSQMQGSIGIRFVIDREECFSHDVQYEGDTLHASFVVIKADTPWSYGDEGVDLVVCSFISFNFLLFPTISLLHSLIF